MTEPHDPFAKTPQGDQPAEPGYGPPQPGFAQPQGGYGAPQPAYGSPQPGYAPAAGGYGSPQSSGFGGGSGRPELAHWGTRVVGALIDGAISVAVQLVLAAVSSSLARLAGLVVLLVFGYLTGTTGQTPGRRVMGITVRREADGQFLGAGAGIGRSFLHILDALPLGLGYLWPLWDSKKQTFADKIIGSVVVKA